MAGLRVELLLLLLVVLTGALLRVSAWTEMKETELLRLYPGLQFQSQSVASSDDNSEYDNEEEEEDPEEEEEEEDPEVDGAVNTTDFNPLVGQGFQVETDSDPELWDRDVDVDSGLQARFPAPPRSWTGSSKSSPELDVVCSDVGFIITLPRGPLSEVKSLGTEGVLSVTSAEASCGYEVDSYENTLTVPFSGCNVKLEATCHTNSYSLQFLYDDELGRTRVATASCEQERTGKLDRSQLPRSGSQPTLKCTDPSPPTPPRPMTSPSKAQNCAVAARERVTCGQSGVSTSDCEKMGCCVDSSTSACYYPLDECTGDQHFIFAIRHNSASIPVDTTKLVIPGSPNCKPVIFNDKVAIFKFKVTECGTRAYEVGETKIYLAEVQSIVQALNLKYGVITRGDPLRFMVECRYSKSGSAQQSLASVGYMVKIPSSALPSSVTSSGLYAVELKLSKDQTYSSYFPTDHQPLRLLLGKPVYLELRLLSPKPDAVVLVNYCIAYPRSAKNALVLVYEGCANPYDKTVSILQVSDLPKNRHQRRFVVKAFQFMDQKTNKYLDEEIYFMCSTEVCRPNEKTCEERCFDGKKP